MEVKRIYSHKDGEVFIGTRRAQQLDEVVAAIAELDAVSCLCKQSEEKTKPPLLYSPQHMNQSLKLYLSRRGWTTPNAKSKKGFSEPRVKLGPREFREMDGISNKVGLEIQFGKYAFMGYDIFSKMVIFSNHGMIDCGIEVVVMPEMIPEMSTGVSSFAQIVMDMKNRGEADLDLPTMIIGLGPTDAEAAAAEEKRQHFKHSPEEMIAAGVVAPKRGGAKPGPKSGSLWG